VRRLRRWTQEVCTRSGAAEGRGDGRDRHRVEQGIRAGRLGIRFRAPGRVAPEVDVAAPRRVDEPEGEGAAAENNESAALDEAGCVGYDARDVGRLDPARRSGKGWLARTL
jgi:hypothetical protein